MLHTPIPEIVIALYALAVIVLTVYTVGEFILFYILKTPGKQGRFHPVLPKVSREELPSVTVQLPMYNELYVAKPLIDSCAQLDYPIDKLEIQVVDDSTDETVDIVKERVEYWSSKGINIKMVHRENREGYKAGALRDATPLAEGEFLAIFDADFRPNPDFLLRTIPYFKNEKVGVVQGRWGHLNRDYSFFTKAQTILLDMFFLIEQEARSKANLLLRFNGSGGVWRKKTVEDAGGWSADTLSEDLDLVIRAQLKGWKVVYDNEVVAPAEVPVNMVDFKAQQYRWTKGKGQVIRKLTGAIAKSKLTLWEKAHVFFDLYNIFVIPSISIIALFSIPISHILLQTDEYNAIFSAFTISLINILLAPVFAFTVLRHYQNSFWSALADFVKSIFPFTFVLLGMSFFQLMSMIEGMFSNTAKFHRTAKYNITSKNDRWNDKVYSPKEVPLFTYVEGVLAVYFFWAIYDDIVMGAIGFLPFHIMLALGFSYVFLTSFKRS